MKPLEPPDSHYLRAAEGWLRLGNHLEAEEELAMISAPMRAHPEVLRIRWEVYAEAKKWELAAEIARALAEMLPDRSFGWIQFAYSLHAMKRTREARAVLLPVVDKFPDQYIFQYSLARYACQLGDIRESKRWLKRACEVADKAEVIEMASLDPDLKPLWNEISKI